MDQIGFDSLNTKLSYDSAILGERVLPDWNNTDSGFKWREQDSGFPIQATVTVRDGEVFLPNMGELAADVTKHTRDVAAHLGRDGTTASLSLQEDAAIKSKSVSALGFPSLLAKALDNLVYKPKQGSRRTNSDVICIKLEDFWDPKDKKFVYNKHRSYTGYNKNGLVYDVYENENQRISLNCWQVEIRGPSD